MILVSVMGEFTPKNYIALFEAAAKSKVVLESTEHILVQNHFVLTTSVDGTWATLPKFIKLLSKIKGVAVQYKDCLSEAPIPGDQTDLYTEYNLSIEIPEPYTNSVANLIDYLLNVGCIVRKLYIKTHTTPFTQSTISSGCIELAVPGTYRQSEAALEELALVAESCNIIIGLNLNLQ